MEDFKKDFVPYDRALRLKALRFDEPCFAFYNGKHLDLGVWDSEYPAGKKRRDIGECPQAPTFQQAFRWFRDVHKLWGYQIPWSGNMYAMTIYRLLEDSETVKTLEDRVIMNTWEETELACLDKLISIVESKSE